MTDYCVVCSTILTLCHLKMCLLLKSKQEVELFWWLHFFGSCLCAFFYGLLLLRLTLSEILIFTARKVSLFASFKLNEFSWWFIVVLLFEYTNCIEDEKLVGKYQKLSLSANKVNFLVHRVYPISKQNSH